jgi:diguanylate cyclase (GGDEF)-like protein
VSDSYFDSDAPEPVTAVHDLQAIQAKLAAERRRDRHLLVRMNGSFVGQVFSLTATRYVLGRAAESEIWVHEDGVSRSHASVEKTPDGWLLRDMGSSNGTFVGGKRVDTHVLADNDLVQLGPSVIFRYAHTDIEHEGMLAALYEASVRDPLTGAFNRDHFDERLRAEISFGTRHKTGVGLIMFDLDHFKQVNDNFGHQAGDQVLVAVVKTVTETIRLEDVLARYGGEEFAVILRNIPIQGLRALAERLRQRIASVRVRTAKGVVTPTASFGLAVLSGSPEAKPDALIAQADENLFAAKRAGRDQVAG